MTRSILLLLAVALTAWAADDGVAEPALDMAPAAAVVGTDEDAITIPRLLSYQGKLTDTMGIPVPNGNYSTRFRLYTQASGGTHYWEETQNVSTEDGLLAVLLGSVTPIPYVPEPGNLYLGMKVGADAEMTPRVRIVSAAYAYLCRKADTADYVASARPSGSAGGDLSGTYPDPTVDGLQGRAVASTAPSTNQVLKWSGSQWVPRTDSVGGGGGGGVTSVAQSTGIVCTPNPITATGTVGLNTSYTDGRYVNVPGDSMSGMLRIGNQLRAHGKAALGYSCNNNGNQAFCAGYGNSASGDYSSITGGEDNSADGRYSHVSGGSENRTTELWATVGGGNVNEATDTAATVAGGMENFATASYTTVGGGQDNWASRRLATVGGGFSNTASDSGATVGGGYDNSATARHTTISGGRENQAESTHATVGGGWSNNARGRYATIGGGSNNLAEGSNSTVGGGFTNDTDTTAATIAGGSHNQAHGHSATIGGGAENDALATQATVSGGYGNSATGENSTIGGGYNNSASGPRATIGGGYENSATNGSATVAGGFQNDALRSYSTVGGGYGNEADGVSATISGGYGNTASGEYATVGGGNDCTAGGQYSVVSGGRFNTASGFAATTAGGYYNHAVGSYSLAAGRDAYLSSSASYSLAFGEGCSTTTSRAVVFYHSGGLTRMGVGVRNPTYQVECSGGAYCTGTYWVSGSDPDDMKDAVELSDRELQAALDELDRTAVMRYRLKSDDSGEEHIGLIAEDAPEAIATPARDGINTADAIGFLFAAIKAQSTRVEQLERELASLRQ